MLAEAPARAIRVGGINIAPGEARPLIIALAPRASPDKTAAAAIPAWAAVGPRPGPRVSVVAAVRGFEAVAARATAELIRSIDPAALAGSLVIVPVMRAGGRFAPGGRPAPTWTFPGDAGGTRAERDAFALFSEVAVGSTALLILAAPPPGRHAVASVRGDLDNPRTRRLAAETGVAVALAARSPAGSLPAAAAEAGISALELRASGAPGSEAADVVQLVAAVRAVLKSVGTLAPDGAAKVEPRRDGRGAEARLARLAPPGPLFVTRSSLVRAPVGGLVEALVVPGQPVRRGEVLARIAPPLGGKPVTVAARRDGLILDGPARLTARPRTRLYALGDLARADLERVIGARPSARRAARARADSHSDSKVRAGWVEHVALPNLGIARLKAKIDTGARTSALHVARMKTVDTAGGPGRRPILEIWVSGHARGTRALKMIKVRAAVREYVVVRDTSGRTERRPVIETAVQIGPFKKRILVTLTNRGDMLFPMLIGRTALGPGIVVDPSRRYLLSIS
ncbi:MAG TPA: RimK/LysX family protein [Polyangia bacterium]|nr:RimK/LysX family protein [Polyangia bacterium]